MFVSAILKPPFYFILIFIFLTLAAGPFYTPDKLVVLPVHSRLHHRRGKYYWLHFYSSLSSGSNVSIFSNF